MKSLSHPENKIYGASEIIKKTEEFIESGKEIYFGKRLQSRSTVKKRTNLDNSHLFRSNQDAESNT